MPLTAISIENLYGIFQKHPKVIIDSRQVEPGCLFFALKGDRFDGNNFAKQAIDKGAAYAIVDDLSVGDNARFLLVEDVLTTLQQLARRHRRQFDIPILAITGSNGKTTTKELVSAVLASHYPAHFTKGNFNNHIGVPLTLLAMPTGTKIAVVEMGANHPGEIDALCQIAEPTHGLITNVGKAHLEGFGDFEGVKKTKSELYQYLSDHNGCVLINSDEPFLSDLAKENKRKIFYEKSEAPSPDYVPFEVKLVASEPFSKVAFLSATGELYTANSHLVGSYNFNNIMTAIAVGKYFKVPAYKIKAAIEGYVPSNNRSQLLHLASNTFLMDAYNANPTSMKNAILSFAAMKADKKIVILGSMLELGSFSEMEHEKLTELALTSGISKVIFVGKEFQKAARQTNTLWFEDTNHLKTWFWQQNFTNAHILVKGSRSIGLEKLVEDTP